MKQTVRKRFRLEMDLPRWCRFKQGFSCKGVCAESGTRSSWPTHAPRKKKQKDHSDNLGFSTQKQFPNLEICQTCWTIGRRGSLALKGQNQKHRFYQWTCSNKGNTPRHIKHMPKSQSKQGTWHVCHMVRVSFGSGAFTTTGPQPKAIVKTWTLLGQGQHDHNTRNNKRIVIFFKNGPPNRVPRWSRCPLQKCARICDYIECPDSRFCFQNTSISTLLALLVSSQCARGLPKVALSCWTQSHTLLKGLFFCHVSVLGCSNMWLGLRVWFWSKMVPAFRTVFWPIWQIWYVSGCFGHCLKETWTWELSMVWSFRVNKPFFQIWFRSVGMLGPNRLFVLFCLFFASLFHWCGPFRFSFGRPQNV